MYIVFNMFDLIDRNWYIFGYSPYRKDARSNKRGIFRSAYGKLSMLRSVCKQGKCKKPYIPITLANKGVNLMINNFLISYYCT